MDGWHLPLSCFDRKCPQIKILSHFQSKNRSGPVHAMWPYSLIIHLTKALLNLAKDGRLQLIGSQLCLRSWTLDLLLPRRMWQSNRNVAGLCDVQELPGIKRGSNCSKQKWSESFYPLSKGQLKKKQQSNLKQSQECVL